MLSRLAIHPHDQIRLRRLHHQVEMIAHHHIRVKLPPAAFHNLKQTTLESLPGLCLQKKFFSIIAATDHMVDSSRI